MSSELKPKLLQDFLLPHLDRETFLEKLCWVDRGKGIFKIFWRHQSSSRFCPDDSCVFRYWAEAKGLWDPKDPKCLTKAKQRIRAALLKLRSVSCIMKDGESRVYKIISSVDSDSNDSQESDAPHADPQSIDDFLESDIFIDQLLRTPKLLLQESLDFLI